MNWSQDRFQSYAEDFASPNGRQTELSDITKIDKIPIYSVTAEFDGTCEDLEAITAKFETIPSFERQAVMIGFDHSDFNVPNDEKRDAFATSLLEILDEIYPESYSGATRVVFVTATLCALLFL